MADSSGNRQDQFRYTGEITSNISEIIHDFLQGTGDLIGVTME